MIGVTGDHSTDSNEGRHCGDAVPGLIVAPNGNLMIQGWGNANDFDSGVAGTSTGWMIQSAVAGSGAMTHYRDIVGEDSMMIDMQSPTYATNATSIVVGAEIDGTPFMDMDVAAIMIYDRGLTDVERGDVEGVAAEDRDRDDARDIVALV